MRFSLPTRHRPQSRVLCLNGMTNHYNLFSPETPFYPQDRGASLLHLRHNKPYLGVAPLPLSDHLTRTGVRLRGLDTSFSFFGNGEGILTPDLIADYFWQNRQIWNDNPPSIIIHGNSETIAGEPHLILSEKSEISYRDLSKILSEITSSPLEIFIASCLPYGASNSFDILPKGSTVLIASQGEDLLKRYGFERFLRNLRDPYTARSMGSTYLANSPSTTVGDSLIEPLLVQVGSKASVVNILNKLERNLNHNSFGSQKLQQKLGEVLAELAPYASRKDVEELRKSLTNGSSIDRLQLYNTWPKAGDETNLLSLALAVQCRIMAPNRAAGPKNFERC